MRVLCFWMALQSVAVANTLLFYEAKVPARIAIEFPPLGQGVTPFEGQMVIDGFLDFEMDLEPDFHLHKSVEGPAPNIWGSFQAGTVSYSATVGIFPAIDWQQKTRFVPGERFEMSGNIGRIRELHNNEMLRYESIRAIDYGFTVNQDTSLTIHGGQLISSEIADVIVEEIAVKPRVIRAGDADKDGDVDFADFLRLSRWYFHDEAFRGWTEGDFTYDGYTRFDDFLLLAANFNRTTVTAVPEPNMSALLCSLLCFRKKRQRRESNPPCRQLEY